MRQNHSQSVLSFGRLAAPAEMTSLPEHPRDAIRIQIRIASLWLAGQGEGEGTRTSKAKGQGEGQEPTRVRAGGAVEN